MLVYEMSHRGCQSKRTSPTNFHIRMERGLSTISKRSLNIVTSALHIFAPGKVGDIQNPLRSRDHYAMTKLGEPDARGVVGLATGSMFQI